MDIKSTLEWEKEIGATLRRARIQARMTQEDLAGRSALSVLTIKNLENGRGSRLASVIQAMSALGLSGSLLPAVPKISPLQILRSRANVAPKRVRRASP